MINKLVVLLVAAGMSMTLCAMPTAEELEKVRPLVQGLMKPDVDAMKLGKKSRSDVATSAMDLYVKADSPAAKMLLARNAFTLFAKAGEYESAEVALDALLKAVPDYPASDFAELLEKALHQLPTRAAPNLRARLAAVKDKAQASSQLKKLLSIYDTLAEGPKRKACAARIAAAYVALDDWPNALKYFADSDSPAASAASTELNPKDAGRANEAAADAWWAVELPKKDAKLSAAFRAHAAALYEKALPTLSGLSKVQAERRIQEANEATTEESEPRTASYGSKKNPYVTKGLVAMWDGEWNAGLGNTDLKAKVWKDVVGGCVCTAVGAPTFSGKATILDGTSCWEIQASPELARVLASDNLTVEIVARFDKNIVRNEGLIGIGANSSRTLWIWGFGRGMPQGAGKGLDFQSRAGTSVQLGKAEMLFGSANTMSLVLSNGELNASVASETTIGRSGAAKVSGPNFIGYIDGYAKLRGEIYCVRIYDRPLDRRELQKNRSVDARRFAN